MNKKTWLAYIVLITCITVLAGSYIQWKDKLSSYYQSTTVATPKESDLNDEAKENDVQPENDVERLLLLTTNQDEQVQKVFHNRLEANEKLDFLIVGSPAMTSGNPGYSERLDAALKEAYGDFINVTVTPISGTSQTFIDEGIAANLDLTKGYDVVLFEPFTLSNNGRVVIEDEHRHVNAFREQLTSHIDDAVLVLQPPQPIHQPNYYLTQVDSLQLFAESAGIPYIDHWTDWPDTESDSLLQLLTEEKAPNDEGAEVWANTLINYFIAEKTEEE